MPSLVNWPVPPVRSRCWSLATCPRCACAWEERDFGEIKIGQPVLVRAAAVRGREFAGKVSFIAPIVEQGRINARGQRNVTDVDVVEVLVDLAQADPLAVGMKVDVYFQPDGR